MLIKNKNNGKKYLVLGFYILDGEKAFITLENKDDPVHIEYEEECEILDNTYSKHWIETKDNYYLPSEWNKENFLYELVDDLSPLDNRAFKDANELIQKEFNYYLFDDTDLARQSAEALGDNWVQCPLCDKVFEAKEDEQMLICPNTICKSELKNPLLELDYNSCPIIPLEANNKEQK